MKIDKVKLSPIKGRNQIVVAFNKELLKDTDFNEGDHVVLVCDKNKIMMVKEEQLKIDE